MHFTNVIAAELDKIRTLSAAVVTAAGTTLTGVAIAAALAGHAANQGEPASAIAVTNQTVPYVQAGLILLGVLPVAHEHAGSQLRTTLVAVPNRRLLVTGKTLAALLAAALTSAATTGASLLAAGLTQRLLDSPAPDSDAEPWMLLGAAGYLTLIALLAHAVALLVRHLVPALVGMLSLVLLLSPVLAGLTEHARWLPDRAGMQLYDLSDTVLTATTGTLVLLGWISVIGAPAIARFITRDP